VAWSSRYQSFDSTFGLERTDALTLRRLGVDYKYRSQPGAAIFDDRQQHWRAETPAAGVQNPDTGTLIQVKSVSKNGAVMDVEVKPARRGRPDWIWDHGHWRWND
jgi:immune inhibitor A